MLLIKRIPPLALLAIGTMMMAINDVIAGGGGQTNAQVPHQFDDRSIGCEIAPVKGAEKESKMLDEFSANMLNKGGNDGQKLEVVKTFVNGFMAEKCDGKNPMEKHKNAMVCDSKNAARKMPPVNALLDNMLMRNGQRQRFGQKTFNNHKQGVHCCEASKKFGEIEAKLEKLAKNEHENGAVTPFLAWFNQSALKRSLAVKNCAMPMADAFLEDLRKLWTEIQQQFKNNHGNGSASGRRRRKRDDAAAMALLMVLVIAAMVPFAKALFAGIAFKALATILALMVIYLMGFAL